jgi:integrase
MDDMPKGWRRSNREGGWSWRKDGRVDVYLTVDTPSGPKRLKTVKKGPDEANAWLTEKRYEHREGAGLFFDASELTVAEFVGRWLEDFVKESVRGVTYVGYEGVFRRHIEPSIGRLRLDKTTPAHVQAWKARLLEAGAGPAAIGQALALLKRSFAKAVEWRLIPRNPALYVTAPRHRTKETPYVRYEDVWRYLRAVEGDPYQALYLIATTGGPRPAELLALRWEDWDEEASDVMIDEAVSALPGGQHEFNDPKTQMGRRRVPLGVLANAALREHHLRFREARMASGERGDYAKRLIFPALRDPSGTTPYSRHALYSRWRKRLSAAGLPHVSLYALRHTATMLLGRANTDPKTVQGILGHANVVTTLRIYTHFVQENAVKAVKNVDALLAEEGPEARPGPP